MKKHLLAVGKYEVSSFTPCALKGSSMLLVNINTSMAYQDFVVKTTCQLPEMMLGNGLLEMPINRLHTGNLRIAFSSQAYSSLFHLQSLIIVQFNARIYMKSQLLTVKHRRAGGVNEGP